MYNRDFIMSTTACESMWRRSTKGANTKSIRGVNTKSMMAFIASSTVFVVIRGKKGKISKNDNQSRIFAMSQRILFGYM